MKKKLKSSGNGWELYFSKHLLQLVGYNPTETKVLISAQNEYLLIKPINPDKISSYENLMVRGFQRSGGSGYGLYFPNPLIEYLELQPDVDYINISIDGDIIKIKKHKINC